MQFPFVGGAYKGRSTNINPQECTNLFPVIDQHGGKNVSALYGTPGLKGFATAAAGDSPVRGMLATYGFLYAICKDTLYKIQSNGTATANGTTINTTSGVVYMAANTTQLMITDGTDGWILTLATDNLAEITDADFPTPGTLTYQDGYFIVSESGTQAIYVSALNDGTSWAALDYASKEGAPDDVVRAISFNRDLWVMGEKSFELWYNSGATYPFSRIEGSYQDIGCGAAASVAKGDNNLFWLDDNALVRKSVGYEIRKASTPQIDYAIGGYSTTSDAIGYVYKDEGNEFYVLAFPTEDVTWVYNNAIDQWHEWSTNSGRHNSNCYAYFAGKHLVGEYNDIEILELDMDTYTDNGTAIARTRVCPVFHHEKELLRYHKFEIDFEPGTGLNTSTGSGRDPQITMKWSDDGAHTWSSSYSRSMGEYQDFTQRAIWRRLGVSRNRVFHVTISEPVKVIIIGAYLEVSK